MVAFLIASAATWIYTLSLHDALPISLSDRVEKCSGPGPRAANLVGPPLVLGCERSEEHTSELQSLRHLVCRLLLEKKNNFVERQRSQRWLRYTIAARATLKSSDSVGL